MEEHAVKFSQLEERMAMEDHDLSLEYDMIVA